jgi:PAS domain S-box-containing protein
MSVRSLQILSIDAEPSALVELWSGIGGVFSKQVVTWKEVETALASGLHDLIVCRAKLADFTACEVMDLLRSGRLDIPLIVIGETADDDIGHEALRRGAADFLKPQDQRKFEAILQREISKFEERRPQGFQKGSAHGLESWHENERLLRIASEAARLGGWMLDLPEGKVTWSDQVCAIYGVSPGTSPTLAAALEYVAEDWRANVVEVFQECMQHGKTFDEEIQLITNHQQKIWVRMVGEPILANDGSIVRVQGALQNITEAKRAQLNAEETLKLSEQIYQKQRAALIELTQCMPHDSMEMKEAFHRITERAATSLNVARVSIWTYTNDRTALKCLDLYDARTHTHSSGMLLVASDYPAYFEGLSKEGFISADDALQSPLTIEFKDNYLIPLGVTSMLDVPVHGSNGIDHIMCNEHIGPLRNWTAQEKTFAVAIANLVSLVLHSAERSRAQNELMESLQRFQSAATATSSTIWDWDLETNVLWWGEGFVDLFGAPATAENTTVDAWFSRIHPEDREGLVKDIYAVIESQENRWSGDYRFIRDSGNVAHLQACGTVIRDGTGKGIRIVGGVVDLTARKLAELELTRSHRALQMLTSCGEMLIRAVDEQELLAEACRLAVEIGGYRMAWVGYVMQDSDKTVMPMAHAGEEHGYLAESIISWAVDHPCADGPVSRCIHSGNPIYLDDIIGNFTSPEYLKPALKRGYRSVICLPFHDEKSVFGVLCLYSSEACQTSQDEIKLLFDMANDLAFGIQNIRARKMAQRMQGMVVKVAQAVSSGSDTAFFDMLTLNMVETLGARGGIIGNYDPSSKTIESISLVFAGQLVPTMSYPIAGTPCECVINGSTCIFTQGLRKLFDQSSLVTDLGMEAYIGLPLLDQAGGVVGIMAVFYSEPLTETQFAQSTLQIFVVRAAAELARQQADARIREQASLLDKAQDAITVRDLNHKITYWNKSAERLFGWTSEEAVGRHADEILFLNPAAFYIAHQQILLDGEWVGEMNKVDKSGRKLIVEVRWTLVKNASGQPISILAIDTDISEYRKLEDQFLRAQRLESIGTLAGGIAHDLNNILSPIFMAAELLKMRDQDARSSELLATIESSAKRGAEMVGQVLSFARGVEGRKFQVHPRQLISEIETIARDTFLKKSYFKIHAKRDLWTIHGDPTQLQQVLLNLCVNAHDATQDGGDISISAENCLIDEDFAALNLEASVGSYVCLQVSDTGIGIPQHIIDRIFDPFFTTKQGNKGTGLGLSTSLTIVKSHGGFIEVSSVPGEGTRFRVYLPAQRESNGTQNAAPNAELPHGNGETILIVDDESAIRDLASQTLRNFGYRTLLAENGLQALALYREHQEEISLVFTDMMMPIMDGSATIEHLSEINPKVKIIAASGVVANREAACRAGHGIKDFLPKPYTSQALLVSIHQALTAA